IRGWICACATGEEAYSIAILLHEHMTAMNREPNVKLFATDIDRASLEFASHGVYPPEALGEMSERRLDRYFVRTESGYEVKQEIRQMIVFAPHNILRDAPFTNLQLVSCRNLLIYFNVEAQQKAISLFHFGLKAGGLMFLGASETPGELSDEFASINKESRLYKKIHDGRLPAGMRARLNPPSLTGHYAPEAVKPEASSAGRGASEMLSAYDRLLAEFMPPAVLIDDSNNVIETFGSGADFLRIRTGRISTSITDMVDGDLRMAITGAIQRVRANGDAVSYDSLHATVGDRQLKCRVVVSPQTQRSGRLFILIRFEELAQTKAESQQGNGPVPESLGNPLADRIRALEDELQHTRENLQATVEELETSNEELQATNEELVASNEELQSTNEELHSVNEELYSVNAEYQRKISELTEMTADMDNLLASTKVHTVFLDCDLRIRRFTPQVVEIFNFVAGDIGRRFDAFTNRLGVPDLESMLARVLNDDVVIERELDDCNGREMILRLLPYHRQDEVGGVVITLVDISTVKAAQRTIADQERRLTMITDNVPALISYVDMDLRYQFVNERYCEFWKKPKSELIGRKIVEVLGQAAFDVIEPNIRRALNGDTLHYETLIPESNAPAFWANVTYVPDIDEGVQKGFFVTVVDTTELKQAENRYDRAVRGAGDGLFDWPIDEQSYYASERLWELIGRPSEGPTGSLPDYFDWVHPDDVDHLKAEIDRHLAGESDSLECDHRVVTPDGSFRWFHSRARVGEDAIGGRRHPAGGNGLPKPAQ
ncbi:MAG: CheR family methyltransferase, partial [Planctomycetota bacterium]